MSRRRSAPNSATITYHSFTLKLIPHILHFSSRSRCGALVLSASRNYSWQFDVATGNCSYTHLNSVYHTEGQVTVKAFHPKTLPLGSEQGFIDLMFVHVMRALFGSASDCLKILQLPTYCVSCVTGFKGGATSLQICLQPLKNNWHPKGRI